MVDLLYALEKAAWVVRVLATHEGRIKERLVKACHQGFPPIPRRGLPDEIQSQYDRIRERVTVEEHSREEGAFAPAIRALSEEEAKEVAAWMCDLESMIDSHVRAESDESG